MTYHIDANEYIAAVRAAGVNLPDFGERYYRETAIPLVNSCYRTGLEGSDAFPIDPDESVEAFARYTGRTLSEWSRNMMRLLTLWCNEAYVAGQRDAKEAAV